MWHGGEKQRINTKFWFRKGNGTTEIHCEVTELNLPSVGSGAAHI
jgi:hypothetical protein